MTRAGSEDGTAGGGGAAEPARENSGGGRAARLAAGGLDALAAGRKGALAEPLHGAFGTAVVHAADGCEGAPHRSHAMESLCVKTLQYISWSRAPQYVSRLSCCRRAAACVANKM